MKPNTTGTSSIRKYGPLLIVDDDTNVGEELVEIFTPHFESVIYCSKADEAIKATQSQTFSAIISDIRMPELSGEQLVRKLRAAGDLTPIVFLTGEASMEHLRCALNLGVSEVFEKPFKATHLIASIDRILEIEKRRRNLFISIGKNELTEQEIQKEKKLLGLLQVVNEQKKAS